MLWEDHRTINEPSWIDEKTLSEITKSRASIISIGFLVHEDDETLVLAQTVGLNAKPGEPDLGDLIQILKGTVKEIIRFGDKA